MNRDALLVYLKDARDLEFARHKTKELIREESARVNSMISNYIAPVQRTQHVARQSVGSLVGAFVSFAVGVLFIYLSTKLFTGYKSRLVAGSDGVYRWVDTPYTDDTFMMIYAWSLVIVGVALLVLGMIKVIKYFRDGSADKANVAIVARENEFEEALEHSNLKNASTLRQRWDKKESYLRRQLQNLDGIIERHYSLNILPNPYRNLASVYYIYDYMSSSNSTLEEVLLHEHMENGIQRILARLDEIITQNETIICETRVIESQNKTLINNTQKMLDSLARLEEDADEAVQYTKMAAANTEATAWFALANYFRN